jgi:hypothetical protein
MSDDAQPRCKIIFENWGWSPAMKAGVRSDPPPSCAGKTLSLPDCVLSDYA